jgi:hypothetical protein
MARLLVLEQADFPQFLAQQLTVRVAKQPVHKRIGVCYFSGDDIQNEDAIMRRFEQTAVANFRSPKGIPDFETIGYFFDG